MVLQLHVAGDERGEGDDDDDHSDEKHDAGGKPPQGVAGRVPVRVGHPQTHFDHKVFEFKYSYVSANEEIFV